MFCKYCAKELNDKTEICVHCGRRVRNSLSGFLENSGLTRLRPIEESKRPGFAWALGFFLSFFCCGPIGYLYLGQWNWFWVTLVITLFAYPLTAFVGAYVLFPWIFAFHQYQMAKDLNEALDLEKDHQEG